MTFDIINFSYGAGLVILPYIVGMCVGMVWRSLDAIRGM
jgi:hypothetical protein